MTNVRVDVDGTTATNVVDYSYSNPDGGEIGEATVIVANTATNRSLFAPGSTVEIFVEDSSNPGSFIRRWKGEVISKPSESSNRNLTLEVSAEAKASHLDYAKVSRSFIERTTAEMVENAIDNKADPERVREVIHKGETTTGWSTNATDFELLDTVSDVTRVGVDSLYFGVTPGTTGTIHAEFDGSSSPVTGRRLDRLETRLLVADKGKNFDGYAILVDGSGIQYTWEIPLRGRAENVLYELPVEDADITTSADYPNGTLRYELVTEGNIPDHRAFMIDSATAITFRVRDRSTTLTHDVEPTSFVTTRRINSSILEMVNRLGDEEGYVGFVTPNDVVNFKESGGEAAPVSIDEDDSTLRVVDVDVDRDYDVTNQVTVQGRGDIRVSFESTQSINFYNEEAPREDPIDDPDIRTEAQAERRAKSYLSANAFDDGAIAFTVANPSFRDVEPGQLMPVTWSAEDLDGDFVVSSVETTSEGYTVINLTGNVSL